MTRNSPLIGSGRRSVGGKPSYTAARGNAGDPRRGVRNGSTATNAHLEQDRCPGQIDGRFNSPPQRRGRIPALHVEYAGHLHPRILILFGQDVPAVGGLTRIGDTAASGLRDARRAIQGRSLTPPRRPGFDGSGSGDAEGADGAAANFGGKQRRSEHFERMPAPGTEERCRSFPMPNRSGKMPRNLFPGCLLRCRPPTSPNVPAPIPDTQEPSHRQWRWGKVKKPEARAVCAIVAVAVPEIPKRDGRCLRQWKFGQSTMVNPGAPMLMFHAGATGISG